MKTPVLLLIFNRADSAKLVMESIKKAKPERLYIAADGPRSSKEGEDVLCRKTREDVMREIDWDCDVKTLFRDNNLGCAVAVSGAINWFFQHEEMGIILEDDCWPHFSFFTFCENLLHYYKNDNRVMHISGFNEQGPRTSAYSYYFSYYPSIWGWATWRRAWENYQFTPAVPDASLESDIISTYFFGMEEVGKRWFADFKRCLTQRSAWGYQWPFSIWKNHGLAITSNNPLVKNLGFDGRGTHTNFTPNKSIRDIQLAEMTGEIVHPPLFLPDQKADIFSFRNQHYPPFAERVRLKVGSLWAKYF